MPRFKYKARNKEGKLVKGVLSADSAEELAEKFNTLGCILVSSNEIRSGKSTTSISRIKQRDLINFFLNIGALLQAGVPMMVSMNDLADQAESKNLSALFKGIGNRINTGASFSQALGAYPQCFPKLYTNIVEAGEITGKLDETLEQLASFVEWLEDLNDKVKSAMIYPVLIVIFMAGLVALLTGVVLPKIIPIFDTVSGGLPLPTRILIGLRNVTVIYWPYILGLIAAAAVGLFFSIRTEFGRYKFDSLKLKLPIFGILFKKMAIMRFCQTLSITTKAGINIIKSFILCEGVVDNKVISREIKQIRDNVETGGTIADSMHMAKTFPLMVSRMIAVGETSGTLDKMLDKVNDFYVKDINRTIQKIFAVIEPLLVILMGGVVGFIAVSIILPIVKAALVIGE